MFGQQRVAFSLCSFPFHFFVQLVNWINQFCLPFNWWCRRKGNRNQWY
jgi:hypothetical protein